MKPQIAVLTAGAPGRWRRRYHAIVEVDRDALDGMGLSRPNFIGARAVGVIEIYYRYADVPQAPSYPHGKCASSRQRAAAIELAERYASDRGIECVGVLS